MAGIEMGSRTKLSIAAAATAAVLAGCGTSQLDSAKTETTIRNLVTSKLGIAVKSVKCPSNIKLKTGLVTICQATMASGETEPFTVTQTDAKGDVNIKPMNLIAGGVEKTITDRLAQRGLKTTTVCPQHVAIVVGRTFTCTATNAKGATGRITATITDNTGAYRLQAG